MGNCCNRFQIHHIGIGISKSFYKDSLCIFLNGAFQFFEIEGIHEGRSDSGIGEGVGKEIIGPAVYVFRRDNVIALMGQILEGIGNRCGTGGHGQSCASAFQCGHSFLEDLFCRVRQPSIYISPCRKRESCRCVFAVMEHI